MAGQTLVTPVPFLGSDDHSTCLYAVQKHVVCARVQKQNQPRRKGWVCLSVFSPQLGEMTHALSNGAR